MKIVMKTITKHVLSIAAPLSLGLAAAHLHLHRLPIRRKPMKINTRTSLAGLIAAIVAFAATNAPAANLLVRNNNDSGAGSLRQAIADNHALGGGNTILFSNVV